MFVPHTFGIALLMIFTSAICWGSWANTYKGVKNYRFMGNTSNDASSFLNNIRTANRSNFIHTLAGGAVFNLANLLLVAANFTGVAISYAIGQSALMVAAWWEVFAWKELEGSHRQAKTFLGLMFLSYVFAILLIAKANTAG